MTPAITQRASLQYNDQKEGDQLSLFENLDDRFTREADRREAAALSELVLKQSKHPAAPSLIRQAWASLVPAILEMSYHQTHDRFNLIESVRKTRNMHSIGSKQLAADFFRHDGKVLNGWILNLLVLVGTLPIDINDGPDLFSIDQDNQRLYVKEEREADGQISAQARSEALVCLEMLCNKAWYCRHIKEMDELHTKAALYGALEFMYWECGIPLALTMLWDEPPELTDRVYDDVRRYNYRQLYAHEANGTLVKLLQDIKVGISALHERREHYHSRFALSLSRDPRWERSFSSQAELIKAKYATMSGD